MFVHPPNEQRTGRAAGQLDLRRHNRATVLRLIWDSVQISRADLARQTGLSRSSVTGIANELLDAGLVYEAQVARSSGGRPPILLEFREDVRHLIGVELGASHISVVLTDLRGRIVSRSFESRPVEDDPTGTLASMVEHIRDLMTKTGLGPQDLAGVGVGVPCPLTAPDALDMNILPKWQGHAPGATLAEALGVPVFMENDANLGALAELWWGAGQGVGDFSYIKIATGVGAGHIIDGRVYRGSGGIAGEIGHTAIDKSGPLCRCGLHGCLEAMIGRASIEKKLGMDLHRILRLAEDDDLAAVRAIHDAGESLGIAVANLLNLLNPARVILGGTLTRAGDTLLTPVRSGARARALFTNVEGSRIVLSELGDDAVALGASTLVLQAALADHTLLTQPASGRLTTEMS